jgi:hypothetical protein
MSSRARTFRITDIPLSIGEEELRKFLISLPRSPGSAADSSRPNVKALSLVPNGPRQMATVAFEDEPESFARVAFRSLYR